MYTFGETKEIIDTKLKNINYESLKENIDKYSFLKTTHPIMNITKEEYFELIMKYDVPNDWFLSETRVLYLVMCSLWTSVFYYVGGSNVEDILNDELAMLLFRKYTFRIYNKENLFEKKYLREPSNILQIIYNLADLDFFDDNWKDIIYLIKFHTVRSYGSVVCDSVIKQFQLLYDNLKKDKNYKRERVTIL